MCCHRRIPPVNIRITYALGIVTLFHILKDKCAHTGYEHYYNPLSEQEYLAFRLKNVQRNTGSNSRRTSISVYKDGPATTLCVTSTVEQLSGDPCREALSVIKHSTDQSSVKERMEVTFKYRQNMIHDPEKSSHILDYFP